MFATAEEIESFIREFETRRLPKSVWTHEAHLVVGEVIGFQSDRTHHHRGPACSIWLPGVDRSGSNRVADTMNSSLQEAIEDIYAAFRDFPRPTSVEGCPCCIDKKGVDVLLSKPLRDLSPEDLGSYSASAFLTVGSVEDYLYFLPRILEILVTEQGWWPNPEVVARGIHTAGFHSWPDTRRKALMRYFDEVIGELLGVEGAGFEIDTWICALGRLHVELEPFLSRIAAIGARLLEYYEVNSQSLADGLLSNSFWDEAPEEQKQVVEWFRSAETQKRIQQQYGLA